MNFRLIFETTLWTVLLTLFAAPAWSNNKDTAQVLTFPLLGPVVPVEGAKSTLVRTDSGVTVRIRTNSLPQGEAFTLWMVVFNNPSYCEHPSEISLCGDPDIANPENPDVAADVMYVAGNVIGNSGKANFAGHRKIGDNSGSIFFPLLPAGMQPPGLQNPEGAEIHIIVHSHGEMLPEYMPSMIQTFGGGCVDPGAPFFGLHFPEWGPQGPNVCQSLQFAVHQP